MINVDHGLYHDPYHIPDVLVCLFAHFCVSYLSCPSCSHLYDSHCGVGSV